MAISTYAELQTALSNWTDRTDLTARYGEFIAIAESEIKRDFARLALRLREMEDREDLAPTAGACTLPADFVAMIKVQARTSAPRRLEFKPRDWLDEAYPDGASGDPAFYTIYGGLLYMFPLTTSSIRIDYYAYPPALSDAATTNWLLTKYPDVYLWASVKHLRLYVSNTQGAAEANALYLAALDGLKGAKFGSALTPGTSRTAAQAAQ